MISYQTIVERNLREIVQAVGSYELLSKLEKSSTEQDKISTRAYFDSIMVHLCKVLDRHRGCVGFWYLYEKNESAFKLLKSFNVNKISALNSLSIQLKKLRDKTLFHIDEESVLEARKIWNDAGVTDKQVREGINYIYEMLYELCDHPDKHSLFRVGCDVKDVSVQSVDDAGEDGLCPCE